MQTGDLSMIDLTSHSDMVGLALLQQQDGYLSAKALQQVHRLPGSTKKKKFKNVGHRKDRGGKGGKLTAKN